jgi:hypothetical protein
MISSLEEHIPCLETYLLHPVNMQIDPVDESTNDVIAGEVFDISVTALIS